MIQRAIWYLRDRYSFGGIAAFVLSMVLAVGLVVFGLAAQSPAPPGLPADVERSVVFPTGDIPVPGPSTGPSEQVP